MSSEILETVFRVELNQTTFEITLRVTRKMDWKYLACVAHPDSDKRVEVTKVHFPSQEGDFNNMPDFLRDKLI